MEISNRLKTVANLVKFKTIADIGTDHGYVPIFLVKENKIQSAIACDINKGPLEKARLNISSYRLSEKIQTRLGSGFLPIDVGETETGVIAGMGGMLMVDILSESKAVVESLKQLVLQPQLDIDQVRKYVHYVGYKIEDEVMVLEDNKFYTAMSCVKGEEKYDSQIEYIFGKKLIEKKDEVLKKYLENEIKKYNYIIESLRNKNTENSRLRLIEADNQIKQCQEVLECL